MFGNMDLYEGNGSTYRYFNWKAAGKPTIPFGFGMSYTHFQYSNLVVNATSFGPCDRL
jgi:hypothetical protein